MKQATQWEESRWYVECPYCGHCLEGEELGFVNNEILSCDLCKKEFEVVGREK